MAWGWDYMGHACANHRPPAKTPHAPRPGPAPWTPRPDTSYRLPVGRYVPVRNTGPACAARCYPVPAHRRGHPAWVGCASYLSGVRRPAFRPIYWILYEQRSVQAWSTCLNRHPPPAHYRLELFWWIHVHPFFRPEVGRSEFFTLIIFLRWQRIDSLRECVPRTKILN